MTIGIISAMPEEMQTLIDNLQDMVSVTKGKRIYYSGTLFNTNVILVFSRWGKVASATTVTQLINDYSVDEIIFTGVAGSVHSKINIGDIIIGKHLYQHDMDASPLYPKFEIPLLNKSYFVTSARLRENLFQASQKFLNNYSNHIDIKKAIVFKINKPKVSIADIASGDQFISKDSIANQIVTKLPSISCVEMEGAAVSQVCYEYDIPFAIIRIISDKANDNSHIDFPKFAKNIASHYALAIFKNYFEDASS